MLFLTLASGNNSGQMQAIPTLAVETEKVLNSISGHTEISFINMFLQADLVVQSVMLVLLFASFWSWAIIFDKFFLIKSIKYKMDKFENEFWSGVSLEKLFRQIKGKQDHPMAMIFLAAIEELQERINKPKQDQLSAGIKERIHQAMQVASNRSMDAIENNLNFLATVGSITPFIGLFGTVWGIMTSFQAISVSKNATLAVVAPGIAEALMATALGLIAAIPAVIFYNKFASETNIISNKLDGFSMELSSIISRELDSN